MIQRPRPTRPTPMALEVMDLNVRLSEHFDPGTNSILLSRLKGLSPEEQAHVVRLCSEARTPASLNLLGYCLQNGIGIDKDLGKAVALYTESAHLGDSCAMANLGCCLEDGLGIPPNKEDAVAWYTKSADLGNTIAMYLLGLCLEDGVGIPRDAKKAVEWYTKSAQLGDPVAMYNLGYCFNEGQGICRDETMAIFWYTKSADLGNRQAMLRLGNLYADGIAVGEYRVGLVRGLSVPVEVNREEAIRWYTKANTHVSHWNLAHFLLKDATTDDATVAFARSYLLATTDADRKACRDQIQGLITTEFATDLLIQKIRGDQEIETLRTEGKTRRDEIEALRTEVETLRTELEFRPGGPGFERVRDDFHAKVRLNDDIAHSE